LDAASSRARVCCMRHPPIGRAWVGNSVRRPGSKGRFSMSFPSPFSFVIEAQKPISSSQYKVIPLTCAELHSGNLKSTGKDKISSLSSLKPLTLSESEFVPPSEPFLPGPFFFWQQIVQPNAIGLTVSLVTLLLGLPVCADSCAEVMRPRGRAIIASFMTAVRRS
jgi:hypothetical protein